VSISDPFFSILEQILKLLDRETGVTNDRRHRVGVDRIVSWQHNSDRAFRHENVFALPINMESGSLQRFDRALMIYARKFRH